MCYEQLIKKRIIIFKKYPYIKYIDHGVAVLSELEVKKGFVIVSHNLNVRYADDTMLIEDTEKKLQKSYRR